MKLIQTAIPDVVIIEPDVYADDRGWFMESFNEDRFNNELKKLGLPLAPHFVQDNHSVSKKNVLRGLHYQKAPHQQGKLVRVVKGAACDIAVDIRAGSTTYGTSVSVELNAENKRMLWIPPGFAHGFLALRDDTHFLYKTTDYYNKDSEASIVWDDKTLALDWPLSVEELPIINQKDKDAPTFLESKQTAISPMLQMDTVRKHVDLRVIGDDRGSLIAIEKGCNLPFSIQRVYYIFGTKPGISRGFHAHKRLQQLMVCIAGKCRIVLDNGKTKEDFWLDSPTKGLLIQDMVWREMHDFSEDCVLVVFASERYDEVDYIRDYGEFVKLKTRL